MQNTISYNTKTFIQSGIQYANRYLLTDLLIQASCSRAMTLSNKQGTW